MANETVSDHFFIMRRNSYKDDSAHSMMMFSHISYPNLELFKKSNKNLLQFLLRHIFQIQNLHACIQ